MHKKQFNSLLLMLLFFAFLSTGCAHKPVTPLHKISNDALLDQNRQTATDKADQIQADSDVEDNLANDFFDEEFEEPQVEVADPLSLWNKGMFHFNDKLYFWALKPVARGYMAVTPEFLRRGIKNFFYNLMMPIRFTNCVLQGKGNGAVFEISKFVINATIGVLGFADPAGKDPELNVSSDEDFGQTLGKYGIGNGFYIVWPVFGPSTLRDSMGLIGDYFLNPLSYVDYLGTFLAVKSIEIVNRTSFHIGEYEAIKEAAIDPYVAIRNSYIQYRQKKITE